MKPLHSFKFLTVKVQTLCCWYFCFVSNRFPCKLIFFLFMWLEMFFLGHLVLSQVSVLIMLVPWGPRIDVLLMPFELAIPND